MVSRSHPGLLRALFAMEVPEVEEGIVEIRAVAREPGHRSKIGVLSNEPGVDPVGACVGPKGSRVRMVVNELRGEKIDVVPWSENSAEFVANALQPAKVKEVRIDEETGTAMVIVPDWMDSSRLMARQSVDFPEPDGPRTTTTSPLRMDMSMCWSTCS